MLLLLLTASKSNPNANYPDRLFARFRNCNKTLPEAVNCTIECPANVTLGQRLRHYENPFKAHNGSTCISNAEVNAGKKLPIFGYQLPIMLVIMWILLFFSALEGTLEKIFQLPQMPYNQIKAATQERDNPQELNEMELQNSQEFEDNPRN